MTRIIELLKSSWSIILTILGFLFYFLYRNKTSQLEHSKVELEIVKVKQQLKEMEEKDIANEKLFKGDLSAYTELTRQHSDLLKKLSDLERSDSDGSSKN